jgi:hypothetical protein
MNSVMKVTKSMEELVFLENPTVAYLLKKSSALYGPRMFITMLTTARHCCPLF